jgi:hypothetical protein
LRGGGGVAPLAAPRSDGTLVRGVLSLPRPIHVAYATLCAVGYGEIVKEVTSEYIRQPKSELMESV